MKGKYIMAVLLCASMVFGLSGCGKKEYVVGNDIKKEEINDFYWTVSTSTFPPHFQRYRFYVDDGKPYFYHETRDGDHFPLYEEDVIVSGTRELPAEEFDKFIESVSGGTVKAREESTETGDSGPWTYLYWENDKDNIQQFSFANRSKEIAFEELCAELLASDGNLVKTVDLYFSTMQYIHFGNPDGRKLVILPGLSLKSVMGAAEAIVNAYTLLAEKYDMYLFDHVGYEKDGYSIASMADDTVKAFEKLGIEHATLMGVSMGGMVSQTIAIDHPEYCDALVLCSTAPRISKETEKLMDNWIELAGSRELAELVESFGEHVYTPAFYQQYKDIILASGDGATEIDFHNFITSANAIRQFDVYDKLKNIKCPVFVINAGNDMVLGSQAADDFISVFPESHYTYEGFGHGVYDEAGDYLQRISDFLETVAN